LKNIFSCGILVLKA